MQTPNTEDLWVTELLTNIFVFVLSTVVLFLGHMYVIPVVFIQFGDNAVILMKVRIFRVDLKANKCDRITFRPFTACVHGHHGESDLVYPVHLNQCADNQVLILQMYVTVVYIQCLIYWACTKLYSTQQIYSQHRPGVGNPGSPNFPGDKPSEDSSTSITMEDKSPPSDDIGPEGNGHLPINDPFVKEKRLLSWQWCEACQVSHNLQDKRQI